MGIFGDSSLVTFPRDSQGRLVFSLVLFFPYGLIVLSVLYIAGVLVANWHFARDLEPASEIPPRISQAEVLKRDAPGCLALAVIVIVVIPSAQLLFHCHARLA
jgi:hypothetical protein